MAKMGQFKSVVVVLLVFVMWSMKTAWADGTVNVADAVLKSTGAVHDTNGWMMSELGYVGLFVYLNDPNTVTVSVKATGAPSQGVNPVLDVHVANQSASWAVASGTPPYTSYNTYSANFSLPKGLYFVRISFTNANLAGRTLYLKDITITGASIDNSISETHVMMAADDYIYNYRRGNIVLNLTYGKNNAPVPQNTPINIQHKRHHFRFTGTVYGVNLTDPAKTGADWLAPKTRTMKQWYQTFLTTRFNSIVLEDAGKWIWNEPQRDVLTLDTVDAILNWAKQNKMGVRVHGAVLYSAQEWATPDWVKALQQQALGGNMSAKQDYRQQITERIGYMVSNRAHLFHTFEVINEDNFTLVDKTIFGYTGLADIFNEATAAAQGKANMIVNEAQILTGNGDSYANWYKTYLHQIQLAGGNFDGVGMQAHFPENASFDPVRVFQTLQNLAVFGKDMVITEFSVNQAVSRENAAVILDKMMRLAFGTDRMVEIAQWSWYDNYGWWPGAALTGFTAGGQNIIFPAGQAYDALVMNYWRTQGQLPAGSNGQISYVGFFGDYEITAGGQTVTVSLPQPGVYAVHLPCIYPNVADMNKDCRMDLNDMAMVSSDWLEDSL